MSFANDVKHWLRDMFRYPAYRPADSSYDEYWHHRDMGTGLNDFQRERVRFLLGIFSNDDSVCDVGCGDGKVLAQVKERKPGIGSLTGLDSSGAALARARERGLDVVQGNIGDPSHLPDIGTHDWVTLLEVIEHVPHSEALLAWALEHVRKGVVFTVPNSGFIVHRLRLLFGRFPLQWRAHPSEHLRFWTLRDMRWWLRALGYRYKLHAYRGVPVLNRLWPAIGSAGLLVVLRK